MKRSKRFEPIEEIASTSAEELRRAMGEAGRRVAELEAQFTKLNDYRNEYVNNAAQGGGAVDAVKLQNYRSFLDRLGSAVRQHLTKLDTARADYEQRRVQWIAKRIEAESLGRVIERFRKEEQQVIEQREQRDGDEAAMWISSTRKGFGDG